MSFAVFAFKVEQSWAATLTFSHSAVAACKQARAYSNLDCIAVSRAFDLTCATAKISCCVSSGDEMVLATVVTLSFLHRGNFLDGREEGV